MNPRLNRCCRLAVTAGVNLIWLAVLATYSAPAFATVIYSGTQNIVLQGPRFGGSTQYTVALAGDATHSWDLIQFQISQVSIVSTAGFNVVSPGVSDVTLSSYLGPPLNNNPQYPFFAENLQNGDPFLPDLVNATGDILLWEYLWSHLGPQYTVDAGDFQNGDGYAAMTFGNGDLGWIQLDIANYRSLYASITLVDWAYSDVPGEQIAIGQTGPTPTPEPSYGVFTIGGLAGLLVVKRTALRQRFVCSSTGGWSLGR